MIFSIIAFVAVMLIMTIMIVSKYNKMVSLDEDVRNESWDRWRMFISEADLIPNLVWLSCRDTCSMKSHTGHHEPEPEPGNISGEMFSTIRKCLQNFSSHRAALSATLSRIMVVTRTLS
ncbi:MAG: hypothetical protein R2941_06840 [Desulfobacterales bacterium]